MVGPLEIEEFTQLYDNPLGDEHQAREQAQQEAASHMLSQESPPDPAKLEAYLR
jgi:hypothetical protein